MSLAIVTLSSACCWDGRPQCLAADPPAAGGRRRRPRSCDKRTAGDDWPRFLGPRATINRPNAAWTPHWPDEGPQDRLAATLGTGYGSPVTSQGRLFQFDRQGNRARLRAVESETGKPLWQFEYPSDTRTSATTTVRAPRPWSMATAFTSSAPKECCTASTPRTGKPIWKVDTTAEFGVVQNFFGVGSTPVVFGDLLIVQVGGSPAEAAASRRQLGPGSSPTARPWSPSTSGRGKVKYKLGDELASYSSPALAKIGGRPWCFVFARGGLLGFDPARARSIFIFPGGRRSWKASTPANPVVVGDQVFISETYGPGSALLKFRPGGYDVVWSDADRRRDKAMQAHWSTPIHHDGYLYGSSGRHDTNAELRCIELATRQSRCGASRI